MSDLNELYMLDEKAFVENAIAKWTKRGLLDKYEGETKKLMAHLFENQERIQQNYAKMRASFYEADQTTTTLGTSVFPTRIVYPLLDQIFPNLIAMQIAQVKPMRSSTARVVYRHYKKSADESNFAHTGSAASTSEVGPVPLARMTLTSSDITAEKYSLRARYSLETVDDAIADGIDFEGEMLAALRDEILGEIDYVVLNDMFNNASSDAVTFSTTLDSYETPKDHQEQLWDAIVDANNNVFTNMQMDCNFIVGAPSAVGRLEKLMAFAFNKESGRDDMFRAGSVRVGTLNNQYAVYKSTMAPANKLLVGIAKVGYLFCPYVPLELTPVDYKDETEELARGVRTRFGRKVTRGDAFSVITIS
jgi:hypothetical protein